MGCARGNSRAILAKVGEARGGVIPSQSFANASDCKQALFRRGRLACRSLGVGRCRDCVDTISESPVMKDLENLDSVSYKRSLVIGTLLGDASSRRRDSRSNMKAQYAIVHGLAQADFVEWKARELGRAYGKTIKVHYDRARNRASCHLTRGRRLRVIHDWFHRGSQKVITDKIRFMDHPIGLSMLLCDNGSVRKRKKTHRDGTVYYLKPSITIAIHGFDRDSVEKLLRHIEGLCGARGYVNPERRWRAGRLAEYNRINFNAENSQKLWEYTKHWIPRLPSMISKFSYAIECFGID